MSEPLAFLPHHFPNKRLDPIQRELYAKLYALTADLNPLEAVRENVLKTLNHIYPSLKAQRDQWKSEGYQQCIDSWCRALGHRLLNKRHLIDALVLTTMRLNENEVEMLKIRKEMMNDMKKLEQEAYIGMPSTPVDFAKYITMIKGVTTP